MYTNFSFTDKNIEIIRSNTVVIGIETATISFVCVDFQ
jgi:hypothetical protein